MEINKFNQTMKYLTRPAERPARILSDDPIETPPVFKTSDPKEAIKEVIRRTEGPVPGIGIAPGISFNPLGTVEDQDPSLTGKFGVGGGELEFGVKEDEGFIGFRKEFEEGGVVERESFRKGSEPLPTDIKNFLKESFPKIDFKFSASQKYGVSKVKDKSLFEKIQKTALKKIKNKNYVYTPVGTDFENLRENLKYKKGYGTGKQLLAKAKEKGINVSDTTDAAAFANKFKIPVKKSPITTGGAQIYNLDVLNDFDTVEKIQRAQVRGGRATPEATEKFLSKNIKKAKKREQGQKRYFAEKKQGGVKKAFQGTKISGVEKSHMNDLFSQYITGQNVGYVPREINVEMGLDKGIDNKMKNLYKKRQRLLEQKPKKQLENINIKGARLAGQSQGFKTFTIMDPVSKKTHEFGGKRFQLDPTNQFPGKTEREIVDFIKNADPDDFDAQLKIKMFEDNRKAVFDAVKKQSPELVKEFKKGSKSTQMLNRLNNQLSMNPLPAEELSKASSAVARGLKNLKLLRPLGYQTGVGGALIGPLDFLGGRPVSEILLDIPTLGIAGQSLRAQRLKQTVGPEVFDKIQEQRAARSEGVGGIESTMFEDFGVDETPLEEAIQARTDREAEVAKTRKIQDVSEMDIMGLPNALKKDREQEIKRDESLDVDDTEFL